MSRNNKNNLNRLTPKLFSPTILRNTVNPENQSVSYTLNDPSLMEDTSIGATSSFKYNIPGTGLVSTQQINIDWSEFQNHTFFNSAQVKTNVAFNKILKEFPFDGTKKEYDLFMDKLTGFEKYIFDNFPKQQGYLVFSGTNINEGFGGTYVTVKDLAGAAYPNSSINRTGETVLNPGNHSMTIEFQLYVPEISSSNQAVLNKHVQTAANDKKGFYVALNSTASLNSGSLSFHVYSGSLSQSIEVPFDKGQWNHFAWVWDRTPGYNTVNGFLNHKLVSSSSNQVEFNYIDTTSSDLLIGSGSSITSLFVPQTTFSGAMDELRIWHNVISLEERKEKEKKNVFASQDLKLCYRFNEPSGSDSNIVLDHSSNSLHGKLSIGGMLLGVRNILSTSYEASASPMIYEKLEYNPVLFPDYADIETYRRTFQVSASLYDQVNPNLITKLIPKHYLLEGQMFDGLETEEGPIVDDFINGTDPRITNMKATQTMLLLLYTWAKFFDELKLFIQTFSTLGWTDYDPKDTTPDEFLQYAAKQYGIELPPLFRGSSIKQFIEAENIGTDYDVSSLNLQQVQNQIWRRILINMNDILKSKGTIHSIKSFIRATGIEPDNVFRIREYGGPTKKNLSFARNNRTESIKFLNFVSGGNISSPYLRGYRTEPGLPIVGTETNEVISLTSASWTYEGLYKFDRNIINNNISQSLVRFHTTGSSGNLLFLNLQFVSGTNSNQTMNLYYLPGDQEPMRLALTGVDLFDGDPWYVSVGFQRANQIGSEVSSSLFIRAAKQINGEIMRSHVTTSYYLCETGSLDRMTVGLNGLIGTNGNASGSFFMVGSSSIPTRAGTNSLNATGLGSVENDEFMFSDFSGKVSQIRFWTKHLTNNEWPEHVKNYRSVGVQNPNINFNFDTTNSGSYERLRLSVEMDQPITQSDNLGQIHLIDFAQNNFHLTGSGFLSTNTILVPETIAFSYISPEFDEGSTTEKIRIRGFQDNENLEVTPWAESSPVYQINPAEEPTDNTKLSIDFSIVDALNQDIVSIFSTLDILDNILGNPELAFSTEYPGLGHLREIYFNKLTDKINIKGFFEFFKWFDTNIGTFISQLVPRKTRYQGCNFIIENSMLERNKIAYSWEEQYIGETITQKRYDILLRLVVGNMIRY